MVVSWLVFALLSVAGPPRATATGDAIRVNQLGYLPDAPKVAVVCALSGALYDTFTVLDERGRTAFGPASARAGGAFGPCAATARLDFTELRRVGRYTIVARSAAAPGVSISSPQIRVDPGVYDGTADTLLYYMREQRSGWNPVFGDSVHVHDGVLVDSPRAADVVHVTGGWADASDYLQYVATSATATFDMLMAYRDHPGAFADHFLADGLPGSNGVPDVLDEARHGLEWLLRMFPDDSDMFNQIADDRDHTYFDLPTKDSSDYGWGKGGARPVYPCTGRPQGLFTNRNRSTGKASTAGKFAAALALGASLYRGSDGNFADSLARRAAAAYSVGRASPGVCQTAPGHSPYFYEEENWSDDMELAAAELSALTGERDYLDQAAVYARQEPVTPWMGADTARHYEWYPWHNDGHREVWRDAAASSRGSARADAALRRTMERYYHDGLARVVTRAHNGFRVGIPFIWCSNDLMTSFATQALLYRQMTGDQQFREYEQAAVDWLFGTNPWGTSMVIGLPRDGVWPHDPHSAVAPALGVDKLLGGLVDGPVYRSIFKNLRGIALLHADEYEAFNGGFIVYHDDLGDYSTNEPIMDGTASLTYLLSALDSRTVRSRAAAPRDDVSGHGALGTNLRTEWRATESFRSRLEPTAIPP
jgi:hypothetical protein